MMTTTNDLNKRGAGQETDPFAGVSRRALTYLPLYLLVPVGFWALMQSLGHGMDWKGFGLGALGWLIALFLRGPLSALVRNLPEERAKTIVGASSGVFEESVRLLLIALTSAALPWAHSVGQGWAAVEVLFVMVNVAVIVSLLPRTDEKAMQAKEILLKQGNLQASPLWGILERVWASAFHIGATLIVAYNPWTVILLIPLHSAFNLTAVKLGQKSLVGTSLFIAAVGLALFGTGLWLAGAV